MESTQNEGSPQKIYFFTGKGGVGKSLLSSVFSAQLKAQGARILYAELIEVISREVRNGFSGFQEKMIAGESFPFVSWDFKSCLEDFIKSYVPTPYLVDLFFQSKMIQGFLNAAPALPELALLGKATSGPRKVGPPLPYSHLVIDSFATGHFLTLLRVPKSMIQMKYSGPMGFHSQKMLDGVKESTIAVVCTVEDIVFEETCEFIDQLKLEFGFDVCVFINRWIPSYSLDFTPKEDWQENLWKNFEKTIQKQNQVKKYFQSQTQKIYHVPMYFQSDKQQLENQLFQQDWSLLP